MFSHAKQAQLRDTEGARVKTCATCVYSSVPVNKMGAAGFLNCFWSPGWKYRSASTTCGFDPSRYVARKEPVKVVA